MRRRAAIAVVLFLAGCGSSTPPAAPHDGGTNRPEGGPGLLDGSPADVGALAGADGALGSADGSSGIDAGGQGIDAGGQGSDGSAGRDGSAAADGAGNGDGSPGSSDAGPMDAFVDAGNICASTADCLAAGEVCGDIRVVNNQIETHCTPANASPPAAPIGAACTSDPGCADNLCLTGISGECSVVCTLSSDCPQGFSCTGYSYTPGPVTVLECSRSCTHNAGCAGGNPGNLCVLETYERQGAWKVDEVCLVPIGRGTLGSTCAGGNDCRAGLCLTTTRLASCTAQSGCNAGETCQCTNGQALPCPGGVMTQCAMRGCSELCNDNTDCNLANQPFMRCAHDVVLNLPNSSTAAISACAR